MPATIDLTKARAIHLDRIRVIRDRELETLDVEYMRAIEVNDTDAATNAVDKKTDLRDMPQNVPESFDSAEDLSAYWPNGGAFGLLPEN